jgi:hypothetical protein
MLTWVVNLASQATGEAIKKRQREALPRRSNTAEMTRYFFLVFFAAFFAAFLAAMTTS